MDNASDRVLIFDTTLRDGEQSPGISLNASEKLEIAQQLARLGVDVIEAGFPIASPGDFEAVQGIARQVEGPVIAGLARTHFADIDVGGERRAATPRARASTRSSRPPTSTSSTSCRRTREDVLGQARAAVAHAREFVEDVEFSPMDATRSEHRVHRRGGRAAIEEGATHDQHPRHRRLRDAARVRRLARRASTSWCRRCGDVVLSVHCHDDLGLAVANSFAGRARRRAPGRVRDQRHRRARRQRLARGDRDAAAHARGRHRPAHRRSTRARSPARAGSSRA